LVDYENKAKSLTFPESREARGLSTPIVKYANHLIVAARLCTKSLAVLVKPSG